MRSSRIFSVIIIVAQLASFPLLSQIPEILSLQGFLTDANGVVLPDGQYTVTFRLYAQRQGGTALWQETQQVELKKGIFNVILGQSTPLSSVNFNQPLYVGISVNNEPELPRFALTAVPYSFFAKRVAHDAIGTLEIADGSITLPKLNTDGARKDQIIRFDGTKLVWDNDRVSVFSLPYKDSVETDTQPGLWILQHAGAPAARFESTSDKLGRATVEVFNVSPDPALYVESKFPTGLAASAIQAIAEGMAPTIYIRNVGSAPAIEAISEGDQATIDVLNTGQGAGIYIRTGIDSREAALQVYSFSTHSGVVAHFEKLRGHPKAVVSDPVVRIHNFGSAGSALLIIDSASAGQRHPSVVILKPPRKNGIQRNSPALMIRGSVDRYFADLVNFVQSGSGTVLNVYHGSTTSVAPALVVEHLGQGTGLKITTHRLQESLQTRDIEAALFVENRSNSSSPVAFFYNKNPASEGEGLWIQHDGRGIALRVERKDTNFARPAAVFRGYSDTTAGVVEIESVYRGFSAGPALVSKGSVYIENRGFTVPLLVQTQAPMIFAAIFNDGDVVIDNGKLIADAIEMPDSTYFSIGNPLSFNSVLIEQDYSRFPGNVDIDGNVTLASNVEIYGNLVVQGTITKGGGSFRIDHPLDPENKYLYHFFVESSEMKNFYDGIAICDDNGEAVVTLPEWFEALNENFRYHLTCIGGYAPVYIKEEIRNNQFVIAGGKPGLKVSWQVTGVRKDKWALEHRMPIEQPKSKPTGQNLQLPDRPQRFPINQPDRPQQ